uniref:Uncharacterized protein n=1 Tax=Magallana gigas TaxID=29159 RepID=K1PXY9_MAGGI
MWRLFLCIVFVTHFIEEDCLKLGISTQCCADFYMKGKKCIPRPKGYFGLNCSYMCPYPTYGRRCLDGKCTCPKEYCNANTGCGTQRILDSNVNDHQHNGKINNAKKSESSSTAVTLAQLDILDQIAFSHVPILVMDVVAWEENASAQKSYVIQKPDVSIKILDGDCDLNDDRLANSDEKRPSRNESKVPMRKDKVGLETLSKRKRKTSSNISGYIDMGKKDPKDYVSMNAENIGL